MEPASLAVGIIALAGLLNNTIECFEYIRVNKTADRDLKTCQFELEHQRLRLLRWGQALGLTIDPESTPEQVPSDHPLLQSGTTQPQIKKINDRLTHIKRLIEDAEAKAKQQSNTDPNDSQTSQQGVTPEDKKLLKLRAKFRSLSLARQRKRGIAKVSWALFGREEFEHLNTSLTSVIDGLQHITSGFQDAQQRLAEQEVAAIVQDKNLEGGLETLQEQVQDSDDDALCRAVEEAMKTKAPASSTTYNTKFYGKNYGIAAGHISGTVHYQAK